jgi:molecular chaperone GrpE
MEDTPVGNEQSQETPPEEESHLHESTLDDSSVAPKLSTEPLDSDATEPFVAPEPFEEEQKPADEILAHMRQLTEEMRGLRRDFDTKVKYDESKERLINTLHKELQNYREGFHFNILHATLIDLISMYDDLEKILEDFKKRENGLSQEMQRNLISFQQSIEDTLRRNEVEAFQAEGETLVAGKQRILKVIDTDNPEQDRYIARRVRKGFEYAGQIILRPEIVEIYRSDTHFQTKEPEK